MKRIISLLLTLTFLLAFSSCGKEQEETNTTTKENTTTIETTTQEPEVTTDVIITPSQPVTISVTCNSTTSSGKLLTKCSAASNGQNVVPGITWTKVDGANAYALYILDESASNWMHMKATTTATEIKEGSSIQGQYKGPYPPSGNHTYVIYVLALDKAPSSLPGTFDSTNQSIDTLKTQISATILGQGQTTVMYANGDNNV